MTTRRTHALVVFTALFLSGCSTHPAIAPSIQASVESNAALIQSQQDLLGEQNEQLEKMTAAQQAMLNSLKAVQSQLADMQRNVIAYTPLTRSSSTELARDSQFPQSKSAAADKLVVGRNEWVWVDLLGRHFNARVNTGIRSSSLNVKDLQPFERNGHSWVRFKLADDEIGEVWEAPLDGYLKVRNAAGDEKERRPVVKLTLRMGSIVEETAVTLTTKKNQLHSIFIGRDFLRDIAVVDVARKFVLPKNEGQTVSR